MHEKHIPLERQPGVSPINKSDMALECVTGADLSASDWMTSGLSSLHEEAKHREAE